MMEAMEEEAVAEMAEAMAWPPLMLLDILPGLPLEGLQCPLRNGGYGDRLHTTPVICPGALRKSD
jgi:hypothetical protein